MSSDVETPGPGAAEKAGQLQARVDELEKKLAAEKAEAEKLSAKLRLYQEACFVRDFEELKLRHNCDVVPETETRLKITAKG